MVKLPFHYISLHSHARETDSPCATAAFPEVSTQMAENLAQWKTLWVEDANPNEEARSGWGWIGMGLGMGVEDWLFIKGLAMDQKHG